MTKLQPAVGQQAFLERSGLDALVRELRRDGYTVLAPVAERGVVALRPVESAGEIAHGVRDEQAPGRYRLSEGDGGMFFQYGLGADSPKRFLFPPVQKLFQMHVEGQELKYESGPPKPPRLAMLGIRPCELAAMAIQDDIFTTGSRCEVDAYYLHTRQQLMVIAVNCTRPGGTCFCASMGTGPEVNSSGYDLALTELRSGFIVKVGSARGAQLIGRLEVRLPTTSELEVAELRMHHAREHMGRTMDTRGLKELLDANVDHPRWEHTARRCLACGNCTMVCPTCFCSSVVDGSDLSGGVSRTRVWDCCYTHQFSYTTAGPIRASIMARYRHWLRHKLCTWFDQFGTSGCVGCGRCITWCPVGIDLTEEVAAIRGSQPAPAAVAPAPAPAQLAPAPPPPTPAPAPAQPAPVRAVPMTHQKSEVRS